jgi:choline dehydrogenase-like flavoprotein
MSSLPDPIREGLKRGWSVAGGPHGDVPPRIACDVAIVGSGAGAGITAELLARAGLDVVIVEEGPLKSSADFNQYESEAYPSLYQESAARKTSDKAVNILQGRCVGGSTTVNWTSSFRTPAATLDHWSRHFGLDEFSSNSLAPFFVEAEQRLSIAAWLLPPNVNNDLLRRGAASLGISTAAMSRNVKDCWSLGSCGLGCPTNAKQSMLVTTLPAALENGARLLVEMRAHRFEIANGNVSALLCGPVKSNGAPASSDRETTRILAGHYVLAAGGINSPAVLLRSEAPDPHGRLGVRTFLHPTVLSAALMPHKVEGWYGAPQTIYTDHFLDAQPVEGPIGFKLEAPPIHPVIFASTVVGIGLQQAELMRQFASSHILIALLRDGFHPQSPGGRVSLRDDGSPELEYPLNDFVMEGARRAHLAMAEIQFAAGAGRVLPVHELARPYGSWSEAKQAIRRLPMKPLFAKFASAHVMGGCGAAGSAKLGVVRPDGVHWQLQNLSVHDGSIFPTSVGANPQLSIYGITNRLTQALARRLGGREVKLV